MATESEFSTRTRIVHILRSIVERPNYYTKRALADRHNVHEDTILGDFQAITTAGFQLDKDERHRSALPFGIETYCNCKSLHFCYSFHPSILE